MISLPELRTLFRGLEQTEIEDWIARRWVLPDESGPEYLFEEIDVARVRLIVTLRHELQVEIAALPIVLSLLDQLHDTQRRLNAARRHLGEGR